LIIGAGMLAAGCSDGITQPTVQSPAGAIALAVGETREIASADAAAIQVSGGPSGAEFVVVPFYGSQAAASTVALEFSGEQLRAAAGPPSSEIARPPSESGPSIVPAG
jgi:hypothetical protein